MGQIQWDLGKSPNFESPKSKRKFSVFESYGVGSPRKTKNFDASSLLHKFGAAKLQTGSFCQSPGFRGKTGSVYGLSPTHSPGLNIAASFDHLPNQQSGEQLFTMTGSKFRSNEINLIAKEGSVGKVGSRDFDGGSSGKMKKVFRVSVSKGSGLGNH